MYLQCLKIMPEYAQRLSWVGILRLQNGCSMLQQASKDRVAMERALLDGTAETKHTLGLIRSTDTFWG